VPQLRGLAHGRKVFSDQLFSIEYEEGALDERPPMQQLEARLLDGHRRALRLAPGHWRGERTFPLPYPRRIHVAATRSQLAALITDPCFRNMPMKYWARLIHLSATYFDFVAHPTYAISSVVRTLNADWFVYFWHLDNLVDEDTESLPRSLWPQLSESVCEIWNADPQSVPRGKAQSPLEAQTVVLLRHHLELLYSLGLTDADLAPYRQSTTEHIRSQFDTHSAAPRDLSEYLARRMVQGGMDCVFKLFVTINLGYFPDWALPLVEIGNLSTCLVNDLFSAPRDAELGTPNAVNIAAGGADEIREMVNQLHAELVTLAVETLQYAPFQDALIAIRTITGIATNMYCWHFFEPRYAAGAREVLAFLEFSGEIPRIGAA
jgi:hypothetical protein